MYKFVNELQDGEHALLLLVIRKKYGIREYRNRFGKFFVIEAGDRTGSIIVKYWGRDQEQTEKLYSELKEGDVIEVSGVFQKDTQPYLSVDAEYDEIKTVKHYDNSRFIPSAENIDEIMAEIMRYVESVENPHLSKLLDIFFGDEDFVDSFKISPCSSSGGYSYIGGLAEHTLNLTKICESLSYIYSLDRDLMVTIALLHDIGKIRSYEIDTMIRLRDEAKLLGHTVISYNMVEEKIRGIIDFPEELKNKILHAIISHHSPIVDNVPQRIRTREAYVLFYGDLLDLSLREFEIEGEEEWLYSKRMKRELFLG